MIFNWQLELDFEASVLWVVVLGALVEWVGGQKFSVLATLKPISRHIVRKTEFLLAINRYKVLSLSDFQYYFTSNHFLLNVSGHYVLDSLFFEGLQIIKI